jgi:hypothetical protein
MARLCYIFKYQEFGEIEPDKAESVVLAFVKPIMKELHWLSKDISATHVIRSIICLLTGIPTIAEKKGKGSKHQHSVSLSEAIESLLEPKQFYIGSSSSYSVPTSFHGSFYIGYSFNRLYIHV